MSDENKSGQVRLVPTNAMKDNLDAIQSASLEIERSKTRNAAEQLELLKRINAGIEVLIEMMLNGNDTEVTSTDRARGIVDRVLAGRQ